MMKRTILCIVGAGLASSALGQDFSLSLVPGTTDIGTGGGSFTVGVYGDSSFGTHMLGGSFGLEITAGCGTGSIDDIQWSAANWSSFNTDGGYNGDGTYNQVIFGQLVIPGVPPFDVPAPGSELGSLIGTFTISLAPNAFDLFDIQLVSGAPFSLEVLDINTGQTMNDTMGTLTLGSAVVGVLCPSPGACGLFAFAGLVGTRRRR